MHYTYTYIEWFYINKTTVHILFWDLPFLHQSMGLFQSVQQSTCGWYLFFNFYFILEYSPLDCKEIQPAHSEGDQPWDFSGRNDAKAETPVLWTPQAKSWLIRKDSDAGRNWGQEEKGTTQDDHGLDGRESEWTLGDGDGQGGLACCDSWGHKESDMTEWLNWTELNWD